MAPVVLIVYGLVLENPALWIVGAVLIPLGLGAASRLRRQAEITR